MKYPLHPASVSLAEDIEEVVGPVSYLLNRNGIRVVGCSTQGIYNLFTVLNLLPRERSKMDFILEIRAEIKEDINTQATELENAMSFIAKTPELDCKYEGFICTENLSAMEVIKKLTTHVALLATTGIERFPSNQGHLGCLHLSNGRLYLDGTELDVELFCNFLYSSVNNHLWWFEK